MFLLFNFLFVDKEFREFKEFRTLLIGSHNNTAVVFNSEFHITTSKRHSVDTFTIVMIMWSRILLQCLPQRCQLIRGKQFFHLFGNIHLQCLPFMLLGESSACFRMAVGIGHVWLDVEDGRSIHQVCAQYLDLSIFNF